MNEHQAILELFQRDIEYFETHHEELLSQYPEQWIAILDEQVVGAAPDPHQLITGLKKKGVPRERVLIRHLTQQEELLIL